MGETEISWTHRPGTIGRSWNPTQGCARVSPGCQSCYAERMASRFAESGWSQGLIDLRTRRWNRVGRVATHKLIEPLTWRKPSTVFVNSMSDLFYEAFSFEEIAAVYGVMAACPQHVFQILTKRPKRRREFFEWLRDQRRVIRGADEEWNGTAASCWDYAKKILAERVGMSLESGVWNSEFLDRAHLVPWPLPNVWEGTSCENQDAAEERIPELLATPAAVRFLSCEPLIGPIHLSEWLARESGLRLIGAPPGIRWCIVGCESGPGARPCEPAWFRKIRDQCAMYGVSFYLKQAVAHSYQVIGTDGNVTDVWDIGAADGTSSKGYGHGGKVLERPYLDGKQHLEFPQ